MTRSVYRGGSNGGWFQYTGQLWLEDAGGYYYKNRTYHAELGVFMQTDPIGQSGGINITAYVGADPVNRVDPWGLEPKDVIMVYGDRSWVGYDDYDSAARWGLEQYFRGNSWEEYSFAEYYTPDSAFGGDVQSNRDPRCSEYGNFQAGDVYRFGFNPGYNIPIDPSIDGYMEAITALAGSATIRDMAEASSFANREIGTSMSMSGRLSNMIWGEAEVVNIRVPRSHILMIHTEGRSRGNHEFSLSQRDRENSMIHPQLIISENGEAYFAYQGSFAKIDGVAYGSPGSICEQ